MGKLGHVIIVIAIVSACYLIMLVVIPVVNDLIVTANATMTADTANLSAYPGAQNFMIASPWILLWVPGTIGLVVVVLILKGG